MKNEDSLGVYEELYVCFVSPSEHNDSEPAIYK